MGHGAVDREWRCTRCQRLLGLVRHKRIHLRLAGNYEYLVTRPATAICRRCRTLNEITENRGPPGK